MRMPDSSPQVIIAEDARYRDPLALIDWPQLRTPGPWLPREALSLHGVTEFDALGDDAHCKLSRYEFANVMYCGLWLESIFLQRVSRLLQPGMPRTEHGRLLHELREETGHSLMFLHTIESGGLALPEVAWRAPRAAALLGRYAPAGGALFWLAMLIGEHVSDGFNRQVCAAPTGVNGAVRDICSLHIADEARHIEHARRKLVTALSTQNAIGRALLSSAAGVLLRQMTSVFYFPPASFYTFAGLPAHTDWQAAARHNPLRRDFIARCLAPTQLLLQSLGLRASR